MKERDEEQRRRVRRAGERGRSMVLTVGDADEPVLRARDELRDVTQSEIDRVVAAYEAWLVDVQTSFPNRIGPKLLSYAIQQTFRAWELSAPSQASTDARPAPKPGQGDALMSPAVLKRVVPVVTFPAQLVHAQPSLHRVRTPPCQVALSKYVVHSCG